MPLSLYGAALAFQAYSYASGSTFPFLRFYIVAIPLSACLAMLAVPDGAFMPATRRGRYAPAQQDSASDPPHRRSSLGYLAVAACFALNRRAWRRRAGEA